MFPRRSAPDRTPPTLLLRSWRRLTRRLVGTTAKKKMPATAQAAVAGREKLAAFAEVTLRSTPRCRSCRTRNHRNRNRRNRSSHSSCNRTHRRCTRCTSRTCTRRRNCSFRSQPRSRLSWSNRNCSPRRCNHCRSCRRNDRTCTGNRQRRWRRRRAGLKRRPQSDPRLTDQHKTRSIVISTWKMPFCVERPKGAARKHWHKPVWLAEQERRTATRAAPTGLHQETGARRVEIPSSATLRNRHANEVARRAEDATIPALRSGASDHLASSGSHRRPRRAIPRGRIRPGSGRTLARLVVWESHDGCGTGSRRCMVAEDKAALRRQATHRQPRCGDSSLRRRLARSARCIDCTKLASGRAVATLDRARSCCRNRQSAHPAAPTACWP